MEVGGERLRRREKARGLRLARWAARYVGLLGRYGVMGLGRPLMHLWALLGRSVFWACHVPLSLTALLRFTAAFSHS
jgi:hypothetical protein